MNTATFRTVALLLLIVALSCVAPGSLWAAFLGFDDTSPAETITVSANDFERGLSLNGSLFQSGLGHPASIPLPETGPIDFSGTWITFNEQPETSGTIYLVESPFIPGTPPPLVSDILQYQIVLATDIQSATIMGSFVSDINDNLGTVPPGTDPSNVFLETTTPVVLSFIGLDISIVSDVEAPEPSTWALCISAGLASFGWFNRRARVMA